MNTIETAPAPASLPALAPRRRRRWPLWTLCLLALLIGWYFKLPALAYYWGITRFNAEAWQTRAVGLHDYRVAVEGLPVQGLSRNASGLTFNPQTNTLFTVINRPPQLAELSTEGRLLRIIPIDGAKDPEGITHVEGDVYVISDEASDSLFWVRIDGDTQRVSTEGQPSLRLSMDVVNNASFEGVSWDEVNRRLYVVREKMPLRVLVITGLEPFATTPRFNIAISEWQSSSASSLFMSDLSSITLHEPTGHLLLLSDESAMVVDYAPDGEPADLLPLWRGFHGLKRKVPQPEGVAMSADGALYVLSEPNLFYRFEPQRQPVWLIR